MDIDDITRELTKFKHDQLVQSKISDLTNHDKQNLDSSLSVKSANTYLKSDDKLKMQKGIKFYKYGCLSSKIAHKLDYLLHLNNITEQFLQSAHDNAINPTKGGSEPPDFGANFHKYTRISVHTLDNYSFQKDIVSELAKLTGKDSVLNGYTFSMDSYFASEISHILNKVCARGFSKQALIYLQAKRKEIRPITSFSDLYKHQPKINL